MIPAVIYASKSTEDRRGSIGTQLDDCRTLAAREGWEVIAEFKDEDRSAYHGNRGPGLAQAKQTAIDHAPCVLVVQDVDRLARGAGDAPGAADHLGELFFQLRRQQVKIWSVRSGEIDSLRAVVEGERAHGESERKAQAVSAGMRRRAAQRGKLPGGHRPYGYKWVFELIDGQRVGSLEVVPAEADVVRRVYEDTVNGASQKAIAQALTREHIPTALGRSRWSDSSIGKMLRNPLYKGMVHVFGEDFPGAHEPIVSDDLWNRAAAIREATARTKGHGGGRRATGSHLFTRGLLHCGSCGSSMLAVTKPNRTGGTYEVYMCSGRRADATTCQQGPIARAAVDDAMLRELLRRWVDLDETRDRLRAQLEAAAAVAAQTLAQAERDEQQTEARLARVQRAFQDGFLDAADYRDQAAGLREERGAARAALAQAREHARQAEARPERVDAESALLRHLAELRQRVSEGLRDAAGLDGLRRLLHHTFEEVKYMPMTDADFAAALGWAAIDPEASDYLVPVLSERILEGIDDDTTSPALRRPALPLHTEVETAHVGLTR